MATERTVMVRLKAETGDFVRGMGTAAAAVKGLTKEIDTSNDRTAWLAQSILALGPALVPLGAAAVPALSGLATQLTVTAAAAGTAYLAFHGVGDALKALNDYQIDPTDAHLKKLNQTMKLIGPQAEQFVYFLDSLTPHLRALQNTARDGLLPGVTTGIEELMHLVPRVRQIVAQISSGLGELAAGAGAELAGPKFRAFFDYIEREARPTLIEMGHTVGNFTEGLANMLVAFGPLSADFSRGLEGMSAAFAHWSRGLATNATFQNFLDYVQASGPKALDLLGSIVDAFVAILHAAAPVGEVMLPALTSLFEIIAQIADTPFGTFFVGAAAAMSIYGRAVALASVSTGGLGKTFGIGTDKIKGMVTALAEVTTAQQRAKMSAEELAAAEGKRTAAIAAGRSQLIKNAALLGGLAVASTGALDSIHLTNTAAGALMGTMGGPWGIAIGAGVGAMLDLAHAGDAGKVSVDGLTETLNQQTGALGKNSGAWADNALNSIGGYQAAQKAGIELSKVRDAMLGDKDALAQVNAEIDDYLHSSVDARQYDERVNVVHDLQVALGDTNDELARGRREIALTAEAQDHSLSGGRAYAKVMQRQKSAIDEQVTALQAAQGAAQETADQFAGLGDKLDDSKTSLKGWIHQLEQMANATRNFRVNAQEAAKRGLDDGLIASLEEAGPTGALRMKQLANATEDEVRRANRAWRSQQVEVNRLSAYISGVPTNINIKAYVEHQQALAAIALIQSRLAGLQDKSIHVDITRTEHTGVDYISGGSRPNASADGSTVPKTGLPYADRHLYLLADGEEVISNRYGQADRHRELLKAINANRLADGGTAWRAARTTSSVERVETVRTIVLDAGSLGRIVHDTATGVSRHEIAQHQRREEVVAGQ